jgi:serine protease Do
MANGVPYSLPEGHPMKCPETRFLQGSTWLLVIGMTAATLSAASGSIPELERMSGETERLSAQVGPKVVQIATQGVKVTGAGEEQPAGILVAERGCGSGFFVSADGYLFTNAHVIANTTRIRVLIQPASGAAHRDSMIEYPATVVGLDADNDLALLKIDVKGVPFFDLSRPSEARQGQLVLAFGSPLGLSQSATFGMVSAVDRQLTPDDPRGYIQTDAPIDPGNSGGPLVDLNGALLGINTMILSQSGGNEGIGLAAPRDVIERAYASLLKTGTVTRPRLGIQPRSLTAELIAGLHLKTREGVLVEDVAPYSAGATAGVLPGDVLVSLNNAAIHNVRDLFRVETGLTAGKPADLAVMRGENLRLCSITPQPPREPAPALSPNVTEKENLVFRLGVYGATLTPEVASSLGGLREDRGVLVLALAGSGLAEQAALAPGDVVHAVNGQPVESVKGLRAALQAVEEGTPVVVQIERAGMHSYVTAGGMTGAEHTPKKASFAPGKPATPTLGY